VRIGLLTGGGDCPGLNAVIRAVVRKGSDQYGDRLIGFRDGWRGVLENVSEELTIESTRGILPRGGTILGSSRTNPFKRDDGAEAVRETLERHGLDGLIVIGGALHVATEAIDRLHTTAESHHRNLVVEVMGRSAGWIALHSGLAGGADVILIPEIPFDIEEVCRLIGRRHDRGRYFAIVVVAEGAVPKEGTMSVSTGQLDEFGHPRLGGIGQVLEREIEQRTGFETRATVLGHIQRGGTPTAFDRVLATRLGLAAIDAAHDGRWGTMTALQSTQIVLVPLKEAVAEVRRVPVEEYERYGVLFG
jgi:6-phosphofructokinase 1